MTSLSASRLMQPPTRKEPPTFVDGPIDGIVIARVESYVDERGWLVELFRSDELAHDVLPVAAYVSQTRPGVTRGPHEHIEQTDLFVFLGDGRLRVYLWDIRADSPTWAHRLRIDVPTDEPTRLLVPPGVVHAYRNISDRPAMVFNAPNRLYAGEGRRSAVDEIRHEGRLDSPYRLD